MRDNVISRFVRRLAGQGALDNVCEVLAARASVDAELDAFAARVTSGPALAKARAAAA